MIEAPAAASSRGGIPLTAPSVPTGMKAGVSTTPWGVESRPRRAAPQVAVTSNVRGTETISQRSPGQPQGLPLRQPLVLRRGRPCACPLRGEVSRLRLRLAAEVDHPGLDPLGDLEHIAVLGDAA